MKKLILLLIIIFSSINFVYSQSSWVSKFFNNVNTVSKIIQRDDNNYLALTGNSKYFFKSSDGGNNWICVQNYSFDSSYNLRDGQFVNSQIGWVVGSSSQYYTGNGAILKTTNGGLNWFKQNTGFNNYHCYCLCFLNENTGWVGSSGGNVGYLLKTTNGGITWTNQNFPGIYQIRGIKFFDSNNGWILGLYGLLARTTNGGQTWLQKPISGYNRYYNLCALDSNECWVLANTVISGMIYSKFFKTSDGGNNWNLMLSYTDSLTTDGHSFWNINFINSSTGLTSGDFNFIFRTSNSGLNWNRINFGSFPFIYPVIASILPININKIFAGGGFSGQGSYEPFSYILKSTDTGTNWITKAYNWHYRFYDVHFKDIQNGIATADTGIIFRTTNGGREWVKTFNNNAFRISSISFANNWEGNAFGANGKILRTTNYGTNWSVSASPTNRNLGISKFVNSQTGFVLTNGAAILKSTNSGSNWSLLHLPLSDSFSCVDMNFINTNTGWILSHRSWGWGYPINIFYYNVNVIKTTNNGINWSMVYDSTAVNSLSSFYGIINFFDNVNGWTMTSNKIMRTTNGGSNWFTYIPSLNFNVNKLVMLNQNTGWAGGTNYVNGNYWGAVFKTTNAGLNWFLQFNEYKKQVRSMYFIDSLTGWFCGDISSVYSTTNGGGNLIGIGQTSNHILSDFFLSQNYPNPFNPTTKIKFDIRHSSNTKLIIYDILGKEIATLVNEKLSAGSYEVDWNGSDYPSGVYFYKLTTNEFSDVKKMLLVK